MGIEVTKPLKTMENNNIESLNSLNEDKQTLEEELTSLDSEKDSEAISEINEKINSLNDEIKSLVGGDDDEDKETLIQTNKRLFARAKTAEGFKLVDGKWVKQSKPAPEVKPEVVEKVVTDESVINKVLDNRELESLDYSDKVKKEIQAYAKLQGVSVKKAMESDYIGFLIEKEEKDNKVDDASLGNNRKGTTKKNYSEMKGTDFDLRTEEGKVGFAKWEEAMKEKLG